MNRVLPFRFASVEQGYQQLDRVAAFDCRTEKLRDGHVLFEVRAQRFHKLAVVKLRVEPVRGVADRLYISVAEAFI